MECRKTKDRTNQEKLFWWLMSSYFELSFINIKISIKLLFQFGRDCLVGRGTFIQPWYLSSRPCTPHDGTRILLGKNLPSIYLLSTIYLPITSLFIYVTTYQPSVYFTLPFHLVKVWLLFYFFLEHFRWNLIDNISIHMYIHLYVWICRNLKNLIEF